MTAAVPTADEPAGRCRAAFRQAFGGAPSLVATAPGRINVIGEHTDYNEGLALPGAIDRRVAVALRPRADRRLVVHSVDFDGRAAWKIGECAAPPAGATHAETTWMSFVGGCVETFQGAFPLEGGFDGCVAGNVPVGAGVSSSAAVEVALMFALRALSDAPLDDLEVVRLCQRFEHRWLGVASGIMDQYTAVFARPDSLLQIDFREVSHQVVGVAMAGLEWVLVDSMRRRHLARTAYSERVQETRHALREVRAAAAEVERFRDLRPEHPDLLRDETLRRRLRHYVTENERVERVVEALRERDFQRVGAALLASHASLRDDYGVSCPELDALVAAAAEVPGCLGARMMGGGFGGSTINLVDADAMAAFRSRVSAAYHDRFGIAPEMRSYRLVGGARVVREP